jgi:acetyl-CoA carboxylase biotin carboxyl carrier protein
LFSGLAALPKSSHFRLYRRSLAGDDAPLKLRLPHHAGRCVTILIASTGRPYLALASSLARGGSSNAVYGGEIMDLQKIKTLIEFAGRSRISELVVSQDGTTVRISNSISKRAAAADNPSVAR